MEIINKKHKQAKRIISKPYISFAHDMNRYFINQAGANLFNLIPGMYSHFMVDIDRVYIYLNDDDSGIKANDNQGGLVFRSAPILNLLNRKNNIISASSKFQIRKSATKIQDSITLEILIHNRITSKKTTPK